ncbi:MAG: PH domain-containing protein [Acidimicrobiia bacterium]
MGYPERLLSYGEKIETQFRPHWSRLLREGFLVLLGVILAGILISLSTPAWVVWLLIVGVVALIARGVTRWLTTHHVITNERVIYRDGRIAKRGKENPLEVINDVAFSQTIFERIFKTGDLLIESAGTHGQTRYRDIPSPEEVQPLIYRVREKRKLQMEGGAAPPASESTASQLEKLSSLRDEGKLTDQEFETEKTKLLGGR